MQHARNDKMTRAEDGAAVQTSSIDVSSCTVLCCRACLLSVSVLLLLLLYTRLVHCVARTSGSIESQSHYRLSTNIAPHHTTPHHHTIAPTFAFSPLAHPPHLSFAHTRNIATLFQQTPYQSNVHSLTLDYCYYRCSRLSNH